MKSIPEAASDSSVAAVHCTPNCVVRAAAEAKGTATLWCLPQGQTIVCALLVAAAVCAAVAPTQLHAEVRLDEIIVTAQRRAESLNKVPLSIAVVNAQTLHDIGAREISAVADFAPNVSVDGIVTTGGSSSTSIYIRGIGQSDILQTTDPGVGLFVDGVYVARALGSLLDVADVERVEVLRGPQGTLFGRNTVGGAINVITKPPGDELAFSARATFGSDDRFDSFLRIDAPFSDNVRSKLSFASFGQDGYVRRPDAGDALGDRQRRVVRAQFVYEPRQTFSLAFSGDYTEVEESGVPATLLRVVQVCPAGVPIAVGGCDANGPAGAPPGQAFLFNNVPPVNLSAGGTGVGTSIYDERYVPGNAFRNAGTGPEESTLDLWGVSTTIDWQLTAFKFRSITAWRTFDAHFVRDADASPYRIVTPVSTVNQQQFSQELHVFDTTPRIDWLVGLFYFDEQADDDSDFDTASFELQSGGVDIINRSAAIFGQATWRFVDNMAFSAGARYTDEDKSYLPTQYIVSSVTGQPPAGTVLIPAIENELAYSKSTWRAAFEYVPAEDLLFYASWSTGFKSGGFVQRNQAPRPMLPTFGPETVEVFEVGAKATLLDGRLRLSGAAFSGDYNDIQVRTIEPNGFALVTSNAGDARIRGGEIEAEAAAGRYLRLLGAIGYLDGRYTRIGDDVPDLTLNSKLPDAPEWSGNLSLVGTMPLHRYSLSGRLDWRYRSTNFNDAENTPELEQAALHLLDASASFRCMECTARVWSATIGVSNLTDELYLVSGNMLAVQGPVSGSYARPRQWFLTVAIEL